MLINIDTLYLLLLIEFTFIMFVVAVVFISRNRKLKTVHQKTLKELVNANDTIDDLMSQKSADGDQTKEAKNNDLIGNEDIPVEGSLEGKEKEELLLRVNEFQEKINEKSALLEEMQKRYDDLEKEYMILYRQQQKVTAP